MLVCILFPCKRDFLTYIYMIITGAYIFYTFDSWKAFLENWVVFYCRIVQYDSRLFKIKCIQQCCAIMSYDKRFISKARIVVR